MTKIKVCLNSITLTISTGHKFFYVKETLNGFKGNEIVMLLLLVFLLALK